MFFQDIPNLCHIDRIFKSQINNTAACKINSKIETTGNNRTKADQQKNNGDGKENFIILYDRKHYLFTSFGAETPKKAGFLVKLLEIKKRSKNLVTVIAENILKITPIANVTAKPLIGPVPR